MKIISLFLILFLFCNLALADELLISFSCYPKLLQERFAEVNLKLDLDGNDRTKDSWGYLKNEGAGYIIYTYRSATKEELSLVLKIAREIEKEMEYPGQIRVTVIRESRAVEYAK